MITNQELAAITTPLFAFITRRDFVLNRLLERLLSDAGILCADDTCVEEPWGYIIAPQECRWWARDINRRDADLWPDTILIYDLKCDTNHLAVAALIGVLDSVPESSEPVQRIAAEPILGALVTLEEMRDCISEFHRAARDPETRLITAVQKAAYTRAADVLAAGFNEATEPAVTVEELHRD